MRDGRPLLNFKSPRVTQPQQHLADMTMEERVAAVTEMGLPAFRAKQLSTHYFTRYHTDVESMTDLPKDLRAPLQERFFPPLLTEVRRLTTTNGDTIKFLWRLFDGALVESVLMRYRNRITLCVSSQCGCGMNCPFCATGQQGLTRNMSTAEIVEQVIRANQAIAAGELAPAKANADADDEVALGAEADEEQGETPGETDSAVSGAGTAASAGGPERGDEHRLHGHGRTPGQLQARDERGAPLRRPGPRGARHVGAPDHGVDGRARARHQQARRRGHPRDLRAQPPRPRRRTPR